MAAGYGVSTQNRGYRLSFIAAFGGNVTEERGPRWVKLSHLTTSALCLGLPRKRKLVGDLRPWRGPSERREMIVRSTRIRGYRHCGDAR